MSPRAIAALCLVALALPAAMSPAKAAGFGGDGTFLLARARFAAGLSS